MTRRILDVKTVHNNFVIALIALVTMGGIALGVLQNASLFTPGMSLTIRYWLSIVPLVVGILPTPSRTKFWINSLALLRFLLYHVWQLQSFHDNHHELFVSCTVKYSSSQSPEYSNTWCSNGSSNIYVCAKVIVLANVVITSYIYSLYLCLKHLL